MGLRCSIPRLEVPTTALNALLPGPTHTHYTPPAVLRNFHRRHYHPSNARIFTYGDLPLEQHLDFVSGNALDKFELVCGSRPRHCPMFAAVQYALCIVRIFSQFAGTGE